MSAVQFISFEEVECGRKIAETKKRFKWSFRIKSRTYILELVNSALSGKRVIMLDSVELYNQKSVLNYDFVFSHIIDGHTFRITKVPEGGINKYELRVDNQSFEDMLANGRIGVGQKKSQSTYRKVQSDPFSEFGSFVNSNNPPPTSNSQFGQFDFDSFSKPSSSTPSNITAQPKQQNIDPFAIGGRKVPNPASYETVNFKTNTFQTNAFQTNSFGNFAQNFKKAEASLLDVDNFSTNTYDFNNHYNDLFQSKKENKAGQQDPSMDAKEGSFFEKFTIETTAKQVFNKVKQVAETIKGKVTGTEDSLI